MKVFVVKKVKDDYSNMFRSSNKHKSMPPITIKALSEFNRISISNPQHNKCIYTISHLQFRTTDANKASLIIGELDSINILPTEIVLNNGPIINYEYRNDAINKAIELSSIDTQANTYHEFSEDYQLLIAPGGSVFIELTTPIKSADLNIDILEDFF